MTVASQRRSGGYCRSRCAERGLAPELRSARFEDFAYGERFAAIVLPAGTFTLIDDFAQAMAALERFHAHLRPGGLLMLDVGSLAEPGARGDGVRRWDELALALEAAGFRDVVISPEHARSRPLRASDRSFSFEALRV